MDELGYERMAQSFAHTGHFSLFGKGGLAYSPLYPVVLSPIYALTSSMHTAYEWAKVENAVLLSLSVFPVYGIARFVLPRGRSVAVAAPVAARAADALQRLRDEREPRLSALPARHVDDAARRPPPERAATTRCCSARSCSPLPHAFSSSCSCPPLSRPSCSWRSRGRSPEKVASAHSGDRSRSTGSSSGSPASRSSPAWSRAAMNGGNLPLAGRYANVGTAHASAWRVIELFFQHLAELDWAVGVIPFAAALLAGLRAGSLRLPAEGARLRVGRGCVDVLAPARGRARRGGLRHHQRPPAQRVGLHRPAADPRALPHLSSSRSSSSRCSRRSACAGRASRLCGTSWASALVAALLPALIPFGTVINGTSADRLLRAAAVRHDEGRPNCSDRPRDDAGRRAARPSWRSSTLLAATRLLPPMAAVVITARHVPRHVRARGREAGDADRAGDDSAFLRTPTGSTGSSASDANVSLVGGAGVRTGPLERDRVLERLDRPPLLHVPARRSARTSASSSWPPGSADRGALRGRSRVAVGVAGACSRAIQSGSSFSSRPRGGTLRLSSALRCGS